MTNLKIYLIALTCLEIAYILLFYFYVEFILNLEHKYFIHVYLAIFHLIVLGLILKQTWKLNHIKKKQKSNRTFLMFFLGIIGMWIWFPENE